jgi:hypothetical protein
MNMALIASEPHGKKSALRFEIDSDTKHMLKLYSEFSGNTKLDPVIIGALKLLFKSDPDFAPWLEQHKRQQPTPPNPVTAGPKTAPTTTKHEAQK